MPKKKTVITPDEQSERFRETVRELAAAGELNPTEADERFEALMDMVASSERERRAKPDTNSPPK